MHHNPTALTSTFRGGHVRHGVRVESDDVLGSNFWSEDPNSQELLSMHWDKSETKQTIEEASKWLEGLGALMGNEIARNAEIIDKNPPKLIKWDRRGNEINFVEHHPAGVETRKLLWSRAGGIFGGQRKEFNGVTVLAAHHMLAQSDCGLFCATAMTPAVALMIRRYGSAEIKARFLPKLEAEEYEKGWRGTIWFTENETGGSDLGSLQTTARFDGQHWRLRGLKWFCSIADADVVMTIARPEGAAAGTKGLCMFLLPRWLDDERTKPNSYSIRRLKPKLGLKSVPSGEVDLQDAVAYPCCGETGDPMDGLGMRRAMDIISPTQRLGVAMMGVGITRRVYFSALAHARVRKIFGHVLVQLPMMQDMLMTLMLESEASIALCFKIASCIGVDGSRKNTKCDNLQRILTPIAKMRCTRRGVEMASIGLEVVGGNGFIEDWSFERQYRDAQNHTIWEGTELVMSMDVFRAAVASNGSAYTELRRFLDGIAQSLTKAAEDGLQSKRTALLLLAGLLLSELRQLPSALAMEDRRLPGAHRFANLLADLVQFGLLCEQALWASSHRGQHRSFVVAALFALRHLSGRENKWRVAVSGKPTCPEPVFEQLVCPKQIVSDEDAFATIVSLLQAPTASQL